MRAYDKDIELMVRFDRRGIDISREDARTLRLAELTLTRWAERECGDGSAWVIARDEETGIPYNHQVDNWERKYRIPDNEAGALRRAREVAERLGLQVYHQGDPRGSALYIGRCDMTDSNYSSVGISCCV